MTEIELLRDKILLFNDFLIEKLGMPKEFFIETNNLIEKAYQEKNMKVLKSGDKEIYLHLKEMSLEMQLELKALFKEKLDLDLDILQKLFDKSIEKIIKRGKILTDDEYRILLDKMNDLTEIKSEEEIKNINTLLIDYSSK
ncbi:hypothetical protein BWK59_14820 [Flavobacterium davisii]|uniref:Uncharacterized protein n=1 Tax=Flavobacterium davisii TaxID=2906077 RepID=A0A246GEV3_9FLAO|nr:hypothetical protein [Flavobacterium davisii]OWP82635.1 hypothetical protein BWK59_14820 [Flavobacterium davisii]